MRGIALLSVLAVLGCGAEAPRNQEHFGKLEQPLLGAQATGSIPSGLPARMMVGLNEGRGSTWMSQSGVPWDVRYQYLSKNWVTNWGHGDRNGQYALDYFYESYDLGAVPAVQFYQIVEEQPAGENMMLTKLGDPATMESYFTDFKILLERVKDYGGPVLVMIEADGYGFAEIQSGDNPDHYAAIADSGLPELAGLPNTVAGWGLAYLQMKQAVGAENALLGIHVSGWSTNYDVMMNNDITDLGTEVDIAYYFLSKLGLSENQTGTTYDFLVGDPSDRDAGYYSNVLGKDKWWDMSDSAPIGSRSMNRFAEWLRLWNVKSGKRWVLWQIPLGNSNHLDIANNGGAREGYKDNRPEYFLGDSGEHIQKFADLGVIALMFGAGMKGMSTFDNDYYFDNQLFVKSRSQSILEAGGLDIAPGLEWQEDTTAPTPRPSTGPDEDTVAFDFAAQYEWEDTGVLAGWKPTGPGITSIQTTTAQAATSSGSLAVDFSGQGGTSRLYVDNPPIPAGTPYVVFHVYLPEGNALESVQPYVQEGSLGNYAWTGNWQDATQLKTGQWNLVFVRMPSDAKAPFSQIGLEFVGGAGFSGTVYVDSVGWPGSATTPTPGAAPSGSAGAGTGGSAATSSDGNVAFQSHASGCSVGSRSSSVGGWWLASLLLGLPALRRRVRRARATAHSQG